VNDPENRQVLGVHKSLQVKGIDWALILEMPTSVAFARAITLQRLAIILLVATSLIVVLIAHFNIHRIVRPLTQLSDVARKIAAGSYSQEIIIGDKTEIGELGNCFNHMAVQLQEAEQARNEADWLKAGQADLVSEVQNEQDIESLCRTIITFLATYIDAQIGALYLVELPVEE